MSNFTSEVAQLCLAERSRFEQGAAKEWYDPQYLRIGEYWNLFPDTAGRTGRSQVRFQPHTTGPSVTIGGKRYAADPATGEPLVAPKGNNNPPWSAAFISFMAKSAIANSGLQPAAFAYSPYHSHYILKALGAVATAGWVARRHGQYAPKVGDLIACGREGAKSATYDTARSFIVPGTGDFFPSHCDFVVAVTAGRVQTIGGNVSNSVGLKNWPTNTAGRIGDHDPHSPSANVICVIESRI